MSDVVYKQCRYPDCVVLISRSNKKTNYCSQHQQIKRQSISVTDKSDELILELKKLKKFYNSTQWKRIRLLQLHREPLCVICGQTGQVVDHIIRLRSGGQSLDFKNLQTMCHRCHNSKRAQEAKESKK